MVLYLIQFNSSRAEDYFAALAKPLTLDADGAGDEEEQPTLLAGMSVISFVLRSMLM